MLWLKLPAAFNDTKSFHNCTYDKVAFNLIFHCVKSAQMRSFFWSVFCCSQSEYRKIRTRKNSVFGHFSHSFLIVIMINIKRNPKQFYQNHYKFQVGAKNYHQMSPQYSVGNFLGMLNKKRAWIGAILSELIRKSSSVDIPTTETGRYFYGQHRKEDF